MSVPRPEDVNAASATDYIQAMIQYTADDVRQVYLRVTAALAVAVLVVTQLPFKQLKALDPLGKGALFVGVMALIVSAVLAHAYLTKIHHARLKLATCLLTSAWQKAQKSGPTYWEKYNWMLNIADALLVLGAVCAGVVMIKLFA